MKSLGGCGTSTGAQCGGTHCRAAPHWLNSPGSRTWRSYSNVPACLPTVRVTLWGGSMNQAWQLFYDFTYSQPVLLQCKIQHYCSYYGDIFSNHRLMCDFCSTASPVFESLLSNCTTKIGQTIKLTCKVRGSPKPVVSWFKGQNTLDTCFEYSIHCCPVCFSLCFNLSTFLSIYSRSSLSQMAFLWRMTPVTSLQKTGPAPAVSSWTTWWQTTLGSIHATLPAAWGTPALWLRLWCRVSRRKHFSTPAVYLYGNAALTVHSLHRRYFTELSSLQLHPDLWAGWRVLVW